MKGGIEVIAETICEDRIVGASVDRQHVLHIAATKALLASGGITHCSFR